MIKIVALNEESEEESDSEEEVSKEALEQIALQQYAKALDLERKGNRGCAIQLLQELLDTELLYEVKKPVVGEKAAGPLFNLKYLCYKNLGAMLNTSGEVEGAIKAYTAAAELDDTDITLWHRFGLVCIQAKHFEMALYAFERGIDRNPGHWPCLDKVITLLLALDCHEQCIITIHEALKLDPGYLRGLAYRKYIYTTYRHMKEYMEYVNPLYKWNEQDDCSIDEEKAKLLIREADVINSAFIEKQEAEKFVCMVPNVKLKKPISKLTWESVGDSLVNMHNYMNENCFSHACIIDIVFELESSAEETGVMEEKKETDSKAIKLDENITDTEKVMEPVSEVENIEISDKDKPTTDTEKAESDVEMATTDTGFESNQEVKTRKNPARRRGSALSFLQQWEWCTKRRSGRKKPASKQDDNIYDTLRRMVPYALVPDVIKKMEDQNKETSPDTADIDKLFEENKNEKTIINEDYFGTESEQNDVKAFIKKYTDDRKDIIDLLKDYLNILSLKWKFKIPNNLSKVFVEANKCYSNHIDIPVFTNDNNEELLHYTRVNMLVEEFLVNEKLNSASEGNIAHSLNVIDSIEIILTVNPHIFPSLECLELVLRQLWVKVHVHLLNKHEDFALDCIYQLQHEFYAMGEHCKLYTLNIVNFTFKPILNESEIIEYIKCLERNIKLSTVKDLFDRGCYDEVISIILDLFDHCKSLAEGEMSLDFAVQLSFILDSYWALNDINSCLKWSFICLHEALKHYFRFTSGTRDYEKWTLTVIKILSSMEHIINTEGITCLDHMTPKELSQGIEDLIRIIGHQVETNASEMPFDSVLAWILMYYILQREEDHGRGRTVTDTDKMPCDDVPNPLMLLFLAHEQLGTRKWCCKSEGKLLYFTLDTVVPLLRSPSLSKSLEQICQHLEQCVYCLFGHPGKKNKIKYLIDHNVNPHVMDWERAQQVYEIYRPPILPALEGKVSGISADTEILFHQILALLPSELDPSKYLPEVEKFIKGVEDRLPSIPQLLPYKMKDIYFLLGDYFFKKEERAMAVKFNMLDVVINNNRFESWAEISLAKSVDLERLLNSCKNINNEKEFLNPARSTIKCFKRSLELDPTCLDLFIEYGNFVYSVHSFCSRLLKQASESLSIQEFEALEKQKEDLLDTTTECFSMVVKDVNNSSDVDKVNDDTWLLFYMLGKAAEKKNKPPSVYLNYYLQGVKSLQEKDATYPMKINYSSPTHLCIEVLELHYRIHASILKYIEQHENKPIPTSVGKVFFKCIEEWQQGPYSRKSKRNNENDNSVKFDDAQYIQAANILKRSISDAGEEDTHETKKLKLEVAAAKVRRSASYDTERTSTGTKDAVNQSMIQTAGLKSDNGAQDHAEDIECNKVNDSKNEKEVELEKCVEKEKINMPSTDGNGKTGQNNEVESSSDNSSSSSSESSSSESSSNSSCDSGRGSECSSKSSSEAEPLTDDEIMKIVEACLDALEDCASRFPPHYKAIYRLAHYHFYYKRGKDIERCRDLMLSTFTCRSGQKLGGLFSERKQSNFFNNIWKIPLSEVERAGGFAFHMSRSVLLTMEILKEIDDHKTLLDLSLHLQRIPELDKKYLRDSDREELAQQAFSLCVQSLKGQLMKFSQQADLKSNDVERQALKSLMLDIYRAYQRAQKQPNSKQFTNLLIDAYKLVTTSPVSENMNLVDLSMKYCQSLIQALKQQATLASLDKSQNAQKKQNTKIIETSKPVVTSPSNQTKQTPSTVASSLPKVSTQEFTAAIQNYTPMLNDPILSQQTAAALSLSYLSNISALAGYTTLPNTLQSSIQNSFQSEFFRQFLGPNYPSYLPPHKKQKRGPRPGTSRPVLPNTGQVKTSKSFSGSFPSMSKSVPSGLTIQKSTSATLAPSMGTVLPVLPASLTSNVPSYTNRTHSNNQGSGLQANVKLSSHMGIHPKTTAAHQQGSPSKTLQEKLSERQKVMPTGTKTVVQDINASISRLPPSLTITKTSSSKGKRPDLKKPSIALDTRPKVVPTGEIIVLDDDDD